MDYKQLSKILEKNINDNLYNNIGKLPTEDEIIEDYDSTRYSVRKAINTLIDKGLVYSVQGSGVFIRKNIKNDYINISFNYGYTGLKNKYPDKKVEYKLINLAIIESQEEIANKMLCEVGKKLSYIIRLIKIDNNFFAVEYTYYDKDVVVYLNKEIIEDSIFKYIQNVLNVKIGFSDRIVYCEKLNSYDAKLLNLSRNSPSLVNENLNYLKNGNIFNFSKIIYNYKYTKLLI